MPGLMKHTSLKRLYAFSAEAGTFFVVYSCVFFSFACGHLQFILTIANGFGAGNIKDLSKSILASLEHG
jgi:hypothetical protein